MFFGVPFLSHSPVRPAVSVLCAVVAFASLPGTGRAQQKYEPADISTIAGVPQRLGRMDGTAGAPWFTYPSGVAADASGNIYVADRASQTIRRISPDGEVQTIAGMHNTPGSSDGTGSAARFNGPHGVAVDTVGNVYVADAGNHTVRKITAEGVVTTIAGTPGSWGSIDARGTAARFNTPHGLTVDGAGTIYVADTYGSTIRKIASDGVVTTLAGLAGNRGNVDGTGTAASFYYPTAIAADGVGNLFVADRQMHTIRKVSADGEVTTLAGLAGTRGSSDGVGSAARFSEPSGLAVDGDGNVYVGDTWNYTIRKVSPDGAVSTLAGATQQRGSTDGSGSAARFDWPYGLAVGPDGRVYVADSGNHLIRAVTPAGAVTTAAGAVALFNRPADVAVGRGGDVYIADSENATIRRIAPDGATSIFAGAAGVRGFTDGTGAAARFWAPWGLSLDAEGNLYVVERGTTVRKITPAGVVTTLAGSPVQGGSVDGPPTVARFSTLTGIAVDAASNVYVVDENESNVRKITPEGNVSTVAGLARNEGSADGSGSAARFSRPYGIAVDGTGNLYVSDQLNQTIRKITPAGLVSTLAGVAGSYGSADGTGNAARFSNPAGLEVDSAGNVYVADSSSNLIRKISPAGDVTTLAGSPKADSLTSEMFSDGRGSAARFNTPLGLGFDAAGKLYIADTLNYTIRLATPLSRFANISTRLRVETGENVLIGGFIVTGSAQTRIIVRALGPSLPMQDRLDNPILELYDGSGQLLESNDDWRNAANQHEITASTIPPPHDREAAILRSVAPGAYTAVVRGSGGGEGVGLVEVYDLGSAENSKLANISTRGRVQTGDDVMIAGLIVTGSGSQKVIVRGIGPSLPVAGKLLDPLLELYDAQGNVIQVNDNWRDDQEAEIIGTSIPPSEASESAIVTFLPPAAYTAVLRGVNDTTGVALVEAFAIQQ